MSEKSGLFEALHELAEVEIETAPVFIELPPNQFLFAEALDLLAATGVLSVHRISGALEVLALGAPEVVMDSGIGGTL